MNRPKGLRLATIGAAANFGDYFLPSSVILSELGLPSGPLQPATAPQVKASNIVHSNQVRNIAKSPESVTCQNLKS